MGPGDLVVLIEDPLLMDGEMLVIGCEADGRLLCEAVYYVKEHEDDAPPRGIFHAQQLLLADVWARAVA